MARRMAPTYMGKKPLPLAIAVDRHYKTYVPAVYRQSHRVCSLIFSQGWQSVTWVHDVQMLLEQSAIDTREIIRRSFVSGAGDQSAFLNRSCGPQILSCSRSSPGRLTPHPTLLKDTPMPGVHDVMCVTFPLHMTKSFR